MTKKKVWLFILKCIIVAGPVILVSLYASFGMMYYSDGEVPYYLWNRDFCAKTHDRTYDVVILGDSIGQTSYITDELSEGTVNLSLGGTTPAENYYVIKEWLEKNKAPDDIFITFMDRHLLDSDCYYTRCLYFHRLPLSDNLEIMARAGEYGEPSIGIDDCYRELLAYQLYWPGKYTAAMVNSRFTGRHESNTMVYDMVNKGRGRFVYADVSYEGDEPVKLDSFYTNPFFDRYYRDIIGLCVEHGIRVHLVKPPMMDLFEFDEGYRRDIYGYYDSICSQYPNVSFDWFDEGFGSDCYADFAHMNEKGAKEFSKMIKEKYPDVFDD